MRHGAVPFPHNFNKGEGMKKKSDILRRGTLVCPKCKSLLHFKVFQGMRLIEDGTYEAKCPKDNNCFKIRADKQEGIWN